MGKETNWSVETLRGTHRNTPGRYSGAVCGGHYRGSMRHLLPHSERAESEYLRVHLAFSSAAPAARRTGVQAKPRVGFLVM